MGKKRKKTTRGSRADSPPVDAPGIRDLVWVDPRTLSDNPLNWRKHPNRQRQNYKSLKSVVGWADALRYNERTGRLFDGHMRKDEAIKAGEEFVPVLVGSWTEEQERLLLQSLDMIGTQAQTDEEALRTLTEKNRRALAKVKGADAKALRRFSGEVGAYAKAIETGDSPRSLYPTLPRREKSKLKKEDPEAYEEDEEVWTRPELKDDVFFRSVDEWGLPELLQDRMATLDDLPRVTYDRTPDTLTQSSYFCHSCRPMPEDRHGGCLGFFTEDWRFEHVFEYPSDFGELLLEEDWACVVSPDFSVYDDYPFPLRLWNLYRSRWCARYWQGLEIRIVPAITRIEEEVTLESLPHPCPTIAFQCRTLSGHGGKFSDFNTMVRACVDYLAPEGVLIYGGVEHQRKLDLPDGPEYILLDSFIQSRKKKRLMGKGPSSKSTPQMGAKRPQNPRR